MFNNPWFIGISISILNGIIVTFVLRKLLIGKENKEYIQKVSNANKEVLFTLRSTVSEGSTPSKQVINSIISATARKYDIEEEDMSNVSEIADDLIKEIMDSSFITSKIKNDYCESLSDLYEKEGLAEEKNVDQFKKEEYKSKIMSNSSILMGILTATMTMLTAYILFTDNTSLQSDFESLYLLFPAMVTSLMAVILLRFKQIFKKREEQNKHSDDDKTTPNKT